MEGKKGFSPSSLKGPAIFNLMYMKTLRSESGGEKGKYGSTVDVVAVWAVYKLSPTAYFGLSTSHLPDVSYSLKSFEIQKRASVA